MSSAAAIIEHVTAVRNGYPLVDSRAILDLLIEPHRGRHLPLGPVSPLDAFGLIVADAFDGVMRGSEWAEFMTNPRTTQIRFSLMQIWHEVVWPRFLRHYNLDGSGWPR